MKKIILTSALSFLVFIAFSQSDFQLVFGGVDSEEGVVKLETNDGNVVLAGMTTDGSGNTDFTLAKLSNCYNTIDWENKYGGSSDETLYEAISTSDGGFVLVGSTLSFGSGLQCIITKVDANGFVEWTRIYGGSGADRFFSVIQTSDGNYLAMGDTRLSSNAEGLIVKISSTGTHMWSKTYSAGSAEENVLSAVELASGDLMVVGKLNTFDHSLLKLDGNGNHIWTKRYLQPGNNNVYQMSMTADGGFLMSGRSNNNTAGGYDSYFVKVDVNGNLQWAKNLGGVSGENTTMHQEMPDGSIVGVTSSSSFGSGSQITLYKMDNLGNFLHASTYGGAGNEGISNFSSSQTVKLYNGELQVLGYTSSYGSGSNDQFLLQIDLDTASATCNYNTINPIINSVIPSVSTSPLSVASSTTGSSVVISQSVKTSTITNVCSVPTCCVADTMVHHDTVIVYDSVAVCDSTVAVFDTTTVFDSIQVPIYYNDTLYHNVYDTSFVTIFDTVVIYDTIYTTTGMLSPDLTDMMLQVTPTITNDIVTVRAINQDVLIDAIRVYDATGRRVLETNVDDNYSEFSIQHLASGNYYLLIESNGFYFSEHIIRN